MDDFRFEQQTEQILDSIDQGLSESEAVDDVERKPGGVLEILLANGERLIVNRHAGAREIWVAAKTGGFHFREQGGRWLDTRSGEELYALLSRVVSSASGSTVILRAPLPFP